MDPENVTKMEYVKSLSLKRLDGFQANTPAMKQYFDVKKQYPDSIVLFRMGDFYEMFFDDAIITSKELEITLTSRGKNQNNVPLAGIPYHALDNYLGKLVEKGYKVAICEQLEDPKQAKGVVKRGVTRVITPGTKPTDLVDASTNNYLASIYQHAEFFVFAVTDLTTNESYATILNYSNLFNELSKYNPSEIIIPESLKLNPDLINELKRNNYLINYVDNSYFSHNESLIIPDTSSLDVDFPLSTSSRLINQVINSLYKYSSYLGINSNIIDNLDIYSVNNYMIIDRVCMRNLELLYNNYDGTSNFSLLSVLNKTKTPMGLRLLKKVILRPLYDLNELNKRLDFVDELKNNFMIREALRLCLKEIYDIERLAIKVSSKSIQPRELNALKRSLIQTQILKDEISKLSSLLSQELNIFDDLNEIIDIIDKGIDDTQNYTLNDRGYIKRSYNDELNNYHELLNNTKQVIADLEAREKNKTKISSLRISYNKVIGYHISVSKSYLKLVPDYFIRKQTLVNAERFIIPELKEIESKIINAEQNIDDLEFKLYSKIIDNLSQFISTLILASKNLAYIDVFASFAEVSHRSNYIRPKFNENNTLELKNSRHSVVEPIEPNFSPNNLYMDKDDFIHIITGPNLSGKSTFMRQIALIQIMAQLGCFVPAEFASLHLVDRVFTRIGASDFLSRGESTFMVEMLETANIINNATSNSLIILDEIGRGTSTFDGIAIAYSVVDYIATTIKAKTLFATHYHQLNRIANKYSFVNNYNVLVKDEGKDIIFLHKIVKGGTNKSYGIHVAKLAGLPKQVIENSLRLINKLDVKDNISDKIFQDFRNQDDSHDNKENKAKSTKINKNSASILDF